MPFGDRHDAGVRLARLLVHLSTEAPVVLGLPRGGVPVALEVALVLGAPLDVLVVRKLGAPAQPELALGAVAEGGLRVINDDLLRRLWVSDAELAAVERRERSEVERQVLRFRGQRPPIELTGRTAVVVDDGLATGATAIAACRVASSRGADRVVLAVPVAPVSWEAELALEADELVAVETPEELIAIGAHYDDFSPVPDDEVIRCLSLAADAAAR